ncbi:hypothetical protein WA158_008477 [Blastocystis sp. Blastoise]
MEASQTLKEPLVTKESKAKTIWSKIIHCSYVHIILYFLIVCGCHYLAYTKNMMNGDFTIVYKSVQYRYINSFYIMLYVIGFIGFLSQFKTIHYYLNMSVFNNKYYMKWMPKTYMDLLLTICILTVNVYWLYYIIPSIKYNNDALTYICRILAPYLNLLWALSLLFCTRNTIWSSVFHMPHVFQLVFHRYIGITTFFVMIVHFLSIFIRWMLDGHWEYFLNFHAKWLKLDFAAATTILVWFSPLFIYAFITSLPWIRRACWEVFYIPHGVICLFIVFFALFHSMNSYRYFSVGLLLYVFDRIKRHVDRNLVRYKINKIETDHGIIRLDISPKGPLYSSLPLPVSFNEFHPFTVADVNGNHVLLHIKPMNGPKTWTNRLHTYINERRVNEISSIYVEGPYGETADIDHESTIVYIGAGVGFAGLSHHLLNTVRRYENGELPKLKQIDVYLTLIDDEYLYWYADQLTYLKSCSIVHLHINITFSKYTEKKSNIYNNQSSGCYTLRDILESTPTFEFSIGRMDPKVTIQQYNKSERQVFFICGPNALYNNTCNQVYTYLKKSTVYTDPFDM